MYKCVIIDDEQPARKLIQNYCNKVQNLEVLGSFKSAIDALPLLNEQAVDLIFLDIQMPEISGIDFLKTLKTTNTHVIFTTAYREYALDAFDLDVVDYLLKPIEFHRFLKAVNKALEPKNSSNNESLSKQEIQTVQLKVNKKQYKVAAADILFIESENEYVAYHTKTFGKLLVYGALKDVITILPKNKFIRVHRSFIVNLSHIEYVEGNRLFIDNQFIAISETYRKEFFKRWNNG